MRVGEIYSDRDGGLWEVNSTAGAEGTIDLIVLDSLDDQNIAVEISTDDPKFREFVFVRSKR